MSQWNALNVNVIKTRKIECAKLNLPAAFAKSPSKKSTPSLKLASTKTENSNSYNKDCKDQLSHSGTDGSSSLLSTEDSFNSSVSAEDDVFQESFETPPEKDGCFSKSSTKRCLSLPAYLGSEERYDNTVHSDVCFRPRQLFEEALNLESYSGSGQSNRVDSRALNQGLGGHSFPRLQENIHKENASRTPHAERMKSTESSSLITCDNNNNNNSKFDKSNLESTKSKSRFENTTQSKGGFDVRSWEQKVLVLTSDYEFGTELSKKPRNESDSRSKSVALTENISIIANEKIAHKPERQVKSETNSEMPKLQTVVWDYIKRKSTKRKRKNETGHLQKDENLKEANFKATNQECSSENVENTAVESCKGELPNHVKKYEADSPGKPGRNDSGILSDISKESRLTKSWKSSPNLKSNCDSKITPNFPIRRYNSYNHLSPTLNHKPSRQLPAKEPQMNSETLTFLLTTATEEKPMHERMMTLKLSREWLLKELKSMREEDRKLARQFIHLRSAIVELREYCEKDDSEYESECEGTQKVIDRESLQKDNKRSALTKERKIHIRETPTRNILSYC